MSEMPDIRASFQRFPRWTQHFWTWWTGKALPGQRPLIRHTWWSYLAGTLGAYFAGLCVSTSAIVVQFPHWWWALAGGWALTIWAARAMILVIAHQCIHKQFSGSARIDAFCGELVTVLTLFQDAKAFKEEHFDAHHRRGVFATSDDPPVEVLLGLGFRPGMTKRRLWIQVLWVFCTPGLYVRGFRDRLLCNLGSGTWRRAGFFLWAGWWLSLPLWAPNGGAALLVAFVLPVIPVAQLSALLDKLGEHAWLSPPHVADGPRYYHVSASWARFCGSAVPTASTPWPRQLIDWPLWVLNMLLYHLPSRLFVIVGDLPNHDWHHRYPGARTWAIAAYERQRDIDEADDDQPPYSEVWGVCEAVSRMFESLSAAAPSSAPDLASGVDAVSHPAV